jgi:CRISPR/Cas system-associated protein Csx1
LLAATPNSKIRESQKKKKIEGLSSEEMARMEKETEGLAKDIKIVKESYGKDMLNLVLACGYLSRILENGKVVNFFSSHYPDILSEFQKIIEATSLST